MSSNTAIAAGGPSWTSLPLSKSSWFNADAVFRKGTAFFALVVIGLTVLIAWQLFEHSRLSIDRYGLAFLTGSDWDPVFKEFGALPFVYGTLVTSALALLMGVPLGLGTALFLVELAPPKVSQWVGFLVELLAAIPSVIYGLVGIFVVVPWVRNVFEPAVSGALGFLPMFEGSPYGVCFMTAGLILSIMIVPFICSVSREVLLTVPKAQREAALALGATRWEVLRMAVLPYARAGIAASIILGLARALGETMAVTMVIGNKPQIVASLFEPGYTMAAVIANEFTEATTDIYLSALVELGLVLFFVTVVMNALGRLMLWKLVVKPTQM